MERKEICTRTRRSTHEITIESQRYTTPCVATQTELRISAGNGTTELRNCGSLRDRRVIGPTVYGNPGNQLRKRSTRARRRRVRSSIGWSVDDEAGCGTVASVVFLS